MKRRRQGQTWWEFCPCRVRGVATLLVAGGGEAIAVGRSEPATSNRSLLPEHPR